MENDLLVVLQEKTRDYKKRILGPALRPVVERMRERAEGGDRIVNYSEDTLTKRFRAYVELAELPASITFHALRHTFATWLVNAGEKLTTVQLLLGQQDLESTKLYAHADGGDLDRAIRNFQLPQAV